MFIIFDFGEAQRTEKAWKGLEMLESPLKSQNEIFKNLGKAENDKSFKT